MNMVSHAKLMHNLKVAKIMKATGYKDSEIATFCGISTKDFLEIIESDDYLRELFESASVKVATEIERKFIENVFKKLEEGDSTDAKFFLERTNPKYSRKDNVNVTANVSIDDIIREQMNNGSNPK